MVETPEVGAPLEWVDETVGAPVWPGASVVWAVVSSAPCEAINEGWLRGVSGRLLTSGAGGVCF